MTKILALPVLAAGLLSMSVAVAQTSAGTEHQHGTPPQNQAGPSTGGGMGMGMMGGGMSMGHGQGGMSMGMMGQHRSMPLDHVEGRIAFLRAELALTETQGSAWGAFAESLRKAAASYNARQKATAARPADQSMAARLEDYEKGLAERLDAVRSARTAYVAFAATLGDEQRKTLDALLRRLFHRAMM